MTVHFDELGSLHRVYATYQLARHFEEAGRKVLLPHLEPGEEGIGSSVSVEHTASALVGMRVTVTATLEKVEGRRLHVCTQAVSDLGDLIGTGSTVQVVLPKEKIDSSFTGLEERWRRHLEERP
jgi:predicted thioesterase